MAWQALFLKIMQFFPVQKALQPRACFEFLSFKHLISGFQRLFMFMFQWKQQWELGYTCKKYYMYLLLFT